MAVRRGDSCHLTLRPQKSRRWCLHRTVARGGGCLRPHPGILFALQVEKLGAKGLIALSKVTMWIIVPLLAQVTLKQNYILKVPQGSELRVCNGPLKLIHPAELNGSLVKRSPHYSEFKKKSYPWASIPFSSMGVYVSNKGINRMIGMGMQMLYVKDIYQADVFCLKKLKSFSQYKENHKFIRSCELNVLNKNLYLGICTVPILSSCLGFSTCVCLIGGCVYNP